MGGGGGRGIWGNPLELHKARRDFPLHGSGPHSGGETNGILHETWVSLELQQHARWWQKTAQFSPGGWRGPGEDSRMGVKMKKNKQKKQAGINVIIR